MTAADKEAVLAFAHRQPAADLVFLRRDITDPAQVDAWIGEIERGHVTTVLALQPDGSLRGYAILDRGALRWMRHVAEIRVLVDAAARRQGLGHILLQVAFEQALASGARKIVAQMTTAQSRALALFESPGFELEATLHNHVIDSQDRTYDLLLLSFNTERQGLQPCDSCGRAPSSAACPWKAISSAGPATSCATWTSAWAASSGVVPGVGLEPTRPCGQRILSSLRASAASLAWTVGHASRRAVITCRSPAFGLPWSPRVATHPAGGSRPPGLWPAASR